MTAPEDETDLVGQLRKLSTSLIADVLTGHAPDRMVMKDVHALTSLTGVVGGPRPNVPDSRSSQVASAP
jgi:hypothetical protein